MKAMNTRLLLIVLAFLSCIATAHAANLTVSDLRVSISYPEPYDRYSNRDDLDDVGAGEQIEADIYPGSVVEFKFDVLNGFSSSEDVDIDNIVATITVEDLDDGDDVE